jgi:hypothetical protein
VSDAGSQQNPRINEDIPISEAFLVPSVCSKSVSKSVPNKKAAKWAGSFSAQLRYAKASFTLKQVKGSALVTI